MASPSQPLLDNTFGGVKAAVRAILGDQKKKWLTDDYLDPIVRHVFGLQLIYLLDTCSPFIEKVVELINVPIGTTDLSSYQNNTSQVTLYGLMDPLRLEWKVTGAPESTYVPVTKALQLPNYSPASPGPLGSMWYEWRRMVIYVTPMTIAIDLRVRGDFLPEPLVEESQIVPLHPLLGVALAEESAGCASRERDNPGALQSYELVGTGALDNIANALVRSDQDTTIRVGRVRGRRGY